MIRNTPVWTSRSTPRYHERTQTLNEYRAVTSCSYPLDSCDVEAPGATVSGTTSTRATG